MSSKRLNISDDLSLPIDAVTQTFAFIGRKGSGKTYGAGKLVEEMLDADVQVVVLDIVGNWYGLRLAADGKGKGYDIPVLGGLRGDIPLAADGGAMVADLVCDTGRSVVIDISQFDAISEYKRFATAFGERLWERKKGETDPTPIHLVIEECQTIIPQFVGDNDRRMVSIYERLVRLGRNYGIGSSMLTQRPQSVNKEALNQAEPLLVFQIGGAHERKALKEWITHQGMSVDLLDELPSLPVGTFYFWSPQWMQLLKKIRIAPKKTLDASSTPKMGEKRVRRELAPLNLEKFQERMKAAIEQAKANDPKLLKAEVARLKAELTKRPKETVEKTVEKVVEKPVVTPAMVKAVQAVVASLEKEGRHRLDVAEALRLSGEKLDETARAFVAALRQAEAPPVRPVQPHRPVIARPATPPRALAAPVSGGAITQRQQRFLDAAATLTMLGTEVTRETVAAWVGVHPRGGSVGEELTALVDAGYILNDRGRITVTESGTAAATTTDPAEAIERAKSGLSDRQRRFFDVIVEAYPNPTTREAIAERFEIHPRGGSLGEDLGRLVGRGLVENQGRGQYRARDFLFAGAA